MGGGGVFKIGKKYVFFSIFWQKRISLHFENISVQTSLNGRGVLLWGRVTLYTERFLTLVDINTKKSNVFKKKWMLSKENPKTFVIGRQNDNRKRKAFYEFKKAYNVFLKEHHVFQSYPFIYIFPS